MSRRVSQVRFPIDQFLAASGSNSIAEAAVLTGTRTSAWHRWAREGGIPEQSADKVAVAAGMHPCEVWSDWWSLTRRAGLERVRSSVQARRHKNAQLRAKASA